MSVAEEWDSLNTEERFYPGSSRKIGYPAGSRQKQVEEEPWDAKPRFYTINGVETEFFPIGALAKAVGRKTVTIRKWESEGILPKGFYKDGEGDRSEGKRRLYTRAQIEGIVEIAKQEGILYEYHKSITKTQFMRRVHDLFRELAAQ